MYNLYYLYFQLHQLQLVVQDILNGRLLKDLTQNFKNNEFVN